MRARPVRSTPHGCCRPKSRAPRAARTTAAAALLPLALTACGTSHPAAGTFSPTGRAATATPLGDPSTASQDPSKLPTPEIDKIVLDRYRAYQKMYQRVYETNDPTDLPTVAIDPVLSRVTADVERTKAKHEIWRFTNISNPKVYARSKDGMTVYVIDCLQTLASYKFSTTTGKRLAGGEGSSYIHRTAVHYSGGQWRVADSIEGDKC